MRAAPEELFKALGDPTRRAIFERLVSEGEQTVRALTDHAGISQPAVSKHLGVLKLAGLVREPLERLSYRWCSSGEEAADGLETVVTWTLSPADGGTLVRMEHSGFRPEDEGFYQGAGHGWRKFVEGLERVAGGLD